MKRGCFAGGMAGVLFVCSVSFAPFMRGQDVHPDGTVTFTVKAPDARGVKLVNMSDPNAMGAKEYVMTKDANGVWSVTTKPCRPGLHYYQLNVDGLECSDPASQMYFGWARWSSMVEVPDPTQDFYLPKDVPHGDVRIHWYHSKTTGAYRNCLIYTPPGYDTDTAKRYPVLFLQHGSGESELGWTMQGKVNFILDNLIAQRKAVPMIIVMDNGYAAKAGSPNPGQVRGEENQFRQLVVTELVPMIDKEYRTIASREGRAIAGLSMGAGQAMNTGLNNLGVFASVGAFSGGGGRRNFDPNTSFSGVFKDASVANEKIKLLWIGCGDLDQGFAGAKTFHETLTGLGIRHTWFECPGSHEWQVWRRHIYEFAQVVFK